MAKKKDKKDIPVREYDADFTDQEHLEALENTDIDKPTKIVVRYNSKGEKEQECT